MSILKTADKAQEYLTQMRNLKDTYVASGNTGAISKITEIEKKMVDLIQHLQK